MVSRTQVRRRDLIGGPSAGIAGTAWLLAACGGGASPAGRPAQTPALSGKLQVWGISLFDFTKDPVGLEIVRDFEALHPGLKVEYTIAADDSGDKTRVAAAADTPPDLTSVNGLVPQSLGADGVAGSFEPLLKTSAVIRKQDLWPTYLKDHSWKGQLVGMAYGPDIRVMYLNGDRFARAGLDAARPPRTWAELEQTVARTTERDGGAVKSAGFHPFIGSGTELTWTVPFWQLGGELLSADGTKVTIDNDKGLQALQWLSKVIDLQGGWAALQELRKAAPAPQLFVNGALACYYEANSTRSGDAFRTAIGAGFKYGFASYPLPPGGRRVTFGGVHTFVMPRGSKQQAAAWAFVEHLLGPDQNVKFADYYDRIPVRQSVAASEQYIRNDPFRKLAAEEMAGRRWLIPAPGAWSMRADVSSVALDLLERGVSVREALAKTQQALQTKLDAALQAAR